MLGVQIQWQIQWPKTSHLQLSSLGIDLSVIVLVYFFVCFPVYVGLCVWRWLWFHRYPSSRLKAPLCARGLQYHSQKSVFPPRQKKLEYYFSTFILKSHLDLLSIKAVKVSLKNHTTFQHSIALHSESYGYKKKRTSYKIYGLHLQITGEFPSAVPYIITGVFSRSYYFVSKPLNLKCSSKTRDNRKPNFQLHFKTRLYLLLS